MIAAAFLSFFLVILLLPGIFFLITQQNTLKCISRGNRCLRPGQVWLQLIPFFNIYWQFVVVNRISDSIRNELFNSTFSFEEQNQLQQAFGSDRPTHGIGMAYCILFCCSIIPILGVLASLAGFICWIIYWVKLSEYKSMLERTNLAFERN